MEIFFSRRSIWVLLEMVRRWTQHFTKIHHEKRKIEQICIWKPMTTGFILYTLIYIISMEFLSLSRRRPSSRKVPSHEEQGETSVSAGSQKNWWCNISSMRCSVSSPDETLRGELKTRHAAQYFWRTSRWYYFSNKMILVWEVMDAKMSSFSSDFQTFIKH